MADDKLIFPIGFDLEEGVAKVEKDWGKMQKRLQDTFKSQTIQVDADISKAVLDKLYAKFEGLIKTMESKAPQIKLKMPDTVDFEQEINRLKVQLKSINLGELTDAESKDLYLYIRQLEALAKALKEVNKQEQLRQANNPANKALQEARAQEKLTRAKANDALAEQRRAKIATETARQNEINNRSAQRGAVIAEQQRAATARAENAELRLTKAKQRSTQATHEQNSAYKTQSSYLQRLAQLMIAYASVTQVFPLLRNIREVTAQFELQRVALGSIIGDLNEANAMFEQIKAAAVKSPFQIKELVTYTKQLAAYKIETDELFETTQKLADVSAGLGVGMERLVLAYGQIRATGYLRASEVRQLTEAGIPIVEELAKKMSDLRGETVSAAEVMGMISERAISFGMVKEVFDDMTSAGGMFYKMQEKQAETLAGQWSNLQDSISIMYDEIGNTEGVNNAMKGMIGLIKSLAENWQLLGNILKITAYQYGAVYAVSLFIPRLVQSTKLLRMAEEAHARAKKLSNAATQRGSAIMAFSAKQTRLYVYWMRQAANANTMFGRGVKRLAAMFLGGGWIGAVIGVLTVAVSWFISARKEANRLNKELERIGAEGDVQSRTQVNNFERLAKVIRDSADGSLRQTEALKEMKRAYGEFLPSQDKEIINLVRAKEGYEAVSQAIREKIALQVQEQKVNAVTSEYSKIISDYLPDLKTLLEPDGIDVSRVYSVLKTAIEDGSLTLIGSVKEDAEAINAILEKELGITLDLFNEGRQLTTKGWKAVFNPSRTMELLRPILNAETKLRNAIQDIEYDLLSDTGITSIYAEKWDELQKNINGITAKGEVGSFEWNKDKTRQEIELYHNFIKERIAEINEGLSDDKKIKFDIGDVFDFDALYEALGNNYPQLKQVVAKIQKEYEKLIPTDITRLANDKLKEYADKVGVSMDDVKEHLKTNEQSTEDWAKGLKGAYESAEKKLTEYKLNRDNAIDIDKKTHWSKAVEEVEDEMKVLKLLMEFFKEFLSDKDTKKTNPRIALLNEELSTVEKIYKEYQELRKLMSEEDARARVADMFEGVNLTMLSQALSPAEMRQQLQKALDEAKKMGDKKQILELEYKLGKFDVDEEQRELEKNLKRLSDQISRTKTAKEFFDRMLGMTGDKEFSASLTLSVYGEGGEDLGTKLAQQTAEAFKAKYKGINFSKTAISDKGVFDWETILMEGEEESFKLGEELYEQFLKDVEAGKKANANWLIDLQKTYEKAFTFEERRTQVMNEEAQKRKEIEESTLLDNTAKKRYTEASKKREAERISAINLEEFKASEDYIKMFEDFERLATPTVERLIAKLREFIATNKENATDLKNLTEQINKLEEGLIKRNPFEGLTKGIERVRQARQKLSASSFKDEKEYTDALDEQEAGYDDIEQALKGIQDEFSKAEQTIRGFADALGIAEDSDMGVFLNGIADAFGYVQKAIVFADFAMKLFDGTIKTFLKSNPLGWVALIAGGVMGAISAIANAKVRKANKEIERQQELIDRLSKSYDKLKEKADSAYGSEFFSNIEARNANLQAQIEAYEKQIEAERSKGKKADADKIKDIQESIDEANEAIAESTKELSERLLGTDLGSAAREFANAWLDAYDEFGNTAEAIEGKFRELIRNMIVEAVLGAVMRKALKPVFDMIENMDSSDIYDPQFWKDFAVVVDKSSKDANTGANAAMQAVENLGAYSRNMTSGLTGISKDIASASEESILGLAAGINTQNFYISQVPPKLDTIIALLQGGGVQVGGGVNMQDLITIQNQHLSHLPNIAQNTAETVARCERAANACERMADQLDRVIKPRGTQATHTVNTSL